MSKPVRATYGGSFAAPRTRRWALVAFVALVAVTGGGSRPDIISLIILRPAAVAFGIFALIAAPSGSFSNHRSPLLLLGALALTILLHLLPLPPGVWQALPGREAVAKMDDALGLTGLWRPLALSPSGAWNALFSLTVPAAAILLYAALDRDDRAIILPLWLVVAATSAALGVAQMLGNPEGPLYFYSVTNKGMPVGWYANGNHQAVTLAASIPLAALWSVRRGKSLYARLAPGTAFAVGFFVVACLTGSRAGIALALLALVLAASILIHSAKTGRNDSASRQRARPQSGLGRSAILAAGIGLAAIGAGIVMIASGAIDPVALLASSQQDEVRFVALPTILAMLGQVWSSGVGAGSFARAYQIFEPAAMLSPYYLNHAHNDWIEVLVEYGLAGAALVAGLLIIVARSLRSTWRRRNLDTRQRVALMTPPLVLAAAALLDYALRVPLTQVLVVLWILGLRDGVPPGPSRGERQRG